MRRLSFQSFSVGVAMLLLMLSMGGLAATMAMQARHDYRVQVARAVTMELQHATATQFAAKATIKATISIRNLPPLQPVYPTPTLVEYPTSEPVVVTPQVTVYVTAAPLLQPTATIERTVVSEVVVSVPVRGRALAVVTATPEPTVTVAPVATLTPVPLWLAPTQTPYVIEFPTATAALPTVEVALPPTPKPEPSIAVEPTATPQPTPGPLDSPIAIPSE